MWAIIRPLYKNMKMHAEPLYHKVGDYLFYIKNLLKMYIKRVRVLSNYKKPKDIWGGAV